MTEPAFIVRPEHLRRYLREATGVRASEMRLPRRGVIVFGGDDRRTLERAFRAKRVPWYRAFSIGKAGRNPVVVARSPIGAPAAAITMEEMAALGVRTFLAFGACGSLRRDLGIGDVVVPTFAVPDEGTSRLYGGPKRPRPDLRLSRTVMATCDHRVPFTRGGTWTVDAVYRESRSRARSLARQGVVAVDMEASAMWAVARLRKLRAASLFVVSDELSGRDWLFGFDDPRFLAAKKEALRIVADVVGRRDL